MYSDKQDFIEIIAQILIRCFLGGVIFLMIWFVCYVTIDEWIYRIHSMWFDISPQQFDFIHYCGMTMTKIILFIVFLIPYICLRMVIRKQRSDKTN